MLSRPQVFVSLLTEVPIAIRFLTAFLIDTTRYHWESFRPSTKAEFLVTLSDTSSHDDLRRILGPAASHRPLAYYISSLREDWMSHNRYVAARDHEVTEPVGQATSRQPSRKPATRKTTKAIPAHPAVKHSPESYIDSSLDEDGMYDTFDVISSKYRAKTAKRKSNIRTITISRARRYYPFFALLKTQWKWDNDNKSKTDVFQERAELLVVQVAFQLRLQYDLRSTTEFVSLFHRLEVSINASRPTATGPWQSWIDRLFDEAARQDAFFEVVHKPAGLSWSLPDAIGTLHDARMRRWVNDYAQAAYDAVATLPGSQPLHEQVLHLDPCTASEATQRDLARSADCNPKTGFAFGILEESHLVGLIAANVRLTCPYWHAVMLMPRRLL